MGRSLGRQGAGVQTKAVDGGFRAIHRASAHQKQTTQTRHGIVNLHGRLAWRRGARARPTRHAGASHGLLASAARLHVANGSTARRGARRETSERVRVRGGRGRGCEGARARGWRLTGRAAGAACEGAATLPRCCHVHSTVRQSHLPTRRRSRSQCPSADVLLLPTMIDRDRSRRRLVAQRAPLRASRRGDVEDKGRV